MRILKVANITTHRNNGMGRVMHSSADELRLLGHTVDFMFSEDVPRRSGKMDRFVFPVALVRAIRERLQHGETYDVVEIHEPSAAWYCHLRRRDKTLPPCVIMSHGSEENYWNHQITLGRLVGHNISIKSRIIVPPTLLSQVKYGLHHCQQVMCLNTQDEQFYRNKSSVAEAQLSRIQHGVEDHFFQDKGDEKDKMPRLLFVGSWLDNKGRHTIAQSFKKLVAQHPNLRLSLLGTGSTQEEVLKWFDHSLRSLIEVYPRVDDKQLITAYSNHEILLLPSFFESWGLVLLEAAAAKMAIVSSKAGGPSDLFEDNQNALLVSATDTLALTIAVTKLIGDPQLRLRLGQQAQERARQFTWKAAAESHLRAYERAVQVAASK